MQSQSQSQSPSCHSLSSLCTHPNSPHFEHFLENRGRGYPRGAKAAKGRMFLLRSPIWYPLVPVDKVRYHVSLLIPFGMVPWTCGTPYTSYSYEGI